jgi:hypothetical protein
MDNTMRRQPPAVSPAKQVLTRAAIVAVILGTILTLLNQPNAIFGTAEIQWLPLTLVYLTPFLVVSVSQILGTRQARKAPAWVMELREGFAATLVSHGIPARAIALGLAAGSINTAIVVTDGLAAGRGLDQVPVALIAQALILPVIFGALSQTLSFRRAIRLASLSAPNAPVRQG